MSKYKKLTKRLKVESLMHRINLEKQKEKYRAYSLQVIKHSRL